MAAIDNLSALKNVGIDKDLINKAGRSAPRPVNIPKVDPVTGAPLQTENRMPASASAATGDDTALQLKRLRDELTTTFTNQLQDLAKQFKAYADATDEKIRNLEQKVRALSQSAPAHAPVSHAASAPAHQDAPKKEEGVIMRVGAGDHAQEINSADVSIGKMFNFSNTKGQRNPDPRSNR